MNEHQPSRTSTETSAAAESRDQHFKTLAVRMAEDQHAKLRFIAQLNDSSLAEEIRIAIEQRIATAQSDPAMLARAEVAREEVERQAAARAAAIAGFMGQTAVDGTSSRSRRTTKNSNE